MSDFVSFRAVAQDGGAEDVILNTRHIVAVSPDEILGHSQIMLHSGATVKVKLPYIKLCERLRCNTELTPE